MYAIGEGNNTITLNLTIEESRNIELFAELHANDYVEDDSSEKVRETLRDLSAALNKILH